MISPTFKEKASISPHQKLQHVTAIARDIATYITERADYEAVTSVIAGGFCSHPHISSCTRLCPLDLLTRVCVRVLVRSSDNFVFALCS